MLFIYPMWDSENERLGFKECTPSGYFLREIAELIGFAGLIALIGIIWRLGIILANNSFCKEHLYILAIPFGIGIISETIFQIAYKIAKHKHYNYDLSNGETSWIKNGERKTYKLHIENKQKPNSQ